MNAQDSRLLKADDILSERGTTMYATVLRVDTYGVELEYGTGAQGFCRHEKMTGLDFFGDIGELVGRALPDQNQGVQSMLSRCGK